MNDRKKPTKFDAILALVGGGLSRKGQVLYNIEHILPEGKKIGDVKSEEIFTYSEEQTPPSESAITTKLNSLITDWEALQYQRDRIYATWQEQMDMQYWDQINGTTTWKDAIAKVKSDNPKE